MAKIVPEVKALQGIVKMLLAVKDIGPDGYELAKELEDMLEPFFIKYHYARPSSTLMWVLN